MRRSMLCLAAVSLLFALAGCRGKEPAPAAAAPPADSSPAAQSAQSTEVGPLSSHEAVAPAAPEQGAAGQAASAIAFDLPSGWQAVRPKSQMRLAQATIPGPGGAGELSVFFFGAGQGGSPAANLSRWSDQMAGGAKPQTGSLTANGLQITWIDAGGTMKPSGMGMGPTTPQPNYRLFGAVVEGTGGPWFFKATGPEATLGPQREAFLKMLQSVRLKGQQA